MTITELKERLYREFINQLYDENRTIEIEPGTTIRMNWQTYISVTKEGAKFLNKELKKLDKQVNGTINGLRIKYAYLRRKENK